jgi:polyhydroxybutyrate depolymerase
LASALEAGPVATAPQKADFAQVLGRLAVLFPMSVRLLFAIVLTLIAEGGKSFAQGFLAGSTTRHVLDIDSRTRTYLLHEPPNVPAIKTIPLVFVFHGGGSNGAAMEKLTGFSALADREGFLVVYPDAVAKNWNDGRDAPAIPSQTNKVDDVAFVAALISEISNQYPVSQRRIFATGISNGAIFSHYLAARLAGQIAAIAPVAGGFAEPLALKFKPGAPVSVFMINGTSDPLVPYQGGPIKPETRGRIIDTDKAAQIWREHDHCNQDAATGDLPDADPNDKCTVRWARWSNGKDGTEVVLYTIEGGGHTWPGGPQYLSPSIIGRVCRDFTGTSAIWEFFKKHPKP